MSTLEFADYDFSLDHARLADLSKERSIICILGRPSSRDVARTYYSSDGQGESWEVRVRGLCYFLAESREDFIAKCEESKLVFIEPARQA